ncbi:ABC transporter permease [Paeniglutamicibacter sulfureus]|uniref:ABC transporter permease n=1 Tax=Paeniglutamicibacter sulfureus TaxID=43666 RepID=UPI002665AB90|nr:ABC transporter permease [Paeniglutamicibacter sulfureus]MDO2934205.1 ABC transporter permease [Paeniglutamicibacter sulfureus]
MSSMVIEKVGVSSIRRSTRWVIPAVVALLVASTMVYIGSVDLDSSEIRSLAPEVIFRSLWEHTQLVAVSTVLTIAIGVPLGILLTRPGAKGISSMILAMANAGQAVPSIGILVLLAMIFGVGFWMAVIALVAYALLPVLRNTMVGINQVDPAIIDAGRGMGMSTREMLFAIELPLSIPVMLAGIRVALILNVGVATLATFTNAGGLGSIISAGISLNRMPVLIVGSVLTICLALIVDWLAGIAEQRLRPKGI